MAGLQRNEGFEGFRPNGGLRDGGVDKDVIPIPSTLEGGLWGMNDILRDRYTSQPKQVRACSRVY